MTKAEIRTLNRQARDARVFAGEAVSRAAYAMARGDTERFESNMADARRLAMKAAELMQQADAA